MKIIKFYIIYKHVNAKCQMKFLKKDIYFGALCCFDFVFTLVYVMKDDKIFAWMFTSYIFGSRLKLGGKS